MKKLILFFTFFISISVYSLPNCPSDTSVGWHNCFGTYTFANGDKYVGAYKDGKWHGRGTYIFANGSSDDGYFMENDYIPDICEKMGLVKGTESFGNCVVRLIDDL